MKHATAIFTLMLLLIVTASAQINPGKKVLFSAKSFADSQADSTAPLRIAGASQLSNLVEFTDSISVQRVVKYAPFGYTNNNQFSIILTDTITVTTTTTARREKVIKSPTVDLLSASGISGYIKIVYTFLGSGNGVAGTTTYTSTLYYMP